MMRRYLEDNQEPNWVPPVLAQPSRRPSSPEEPQIRGYLDEGPPLTTQLSFSRHARPESPPGPGQCLGKRTLPDWDTEFVIDNPYILTPDDDAEEDTDTM